MAPLLKATCGICTALQGIDLLALVIPHVCHKYSNVSFLIGRGDSPSPCTAFVGVPPPPPCTASLGLQGASWERHRDGHPIDAGGDQPLDYPLLPPSSHPQAAMGPSASCWRRWSRSRASATECASSGRWVLLEASLLHHPPVGDMVEHPAIYRPPVTVKV